MIVSSGVYGPGSSTDNAIVRWDGATGKLIQNSIVIVSDAGSITGSTSITQANITWNNVNGFVSTADMNFTSAAQMNFTTGPGLADINFVSFAGALNAAADKDSIFYSNSGSFSVIGATGTLLQSSGGDVNLDSQSANVQIDANQAIFVTAKDLDVTIEAQTTDIVLNAGGNINANAPLVMDTHRIFLGTSFASSIVHDGTSLIINPKVFGSFDCVIGSSSASGGNDANLRVFRLAVGGSDILGTAIINCVISGAARSALNFVLTFTSSGTVGAPFTANFIDQSTGSNMVFTNPMEYTLNTNSHSTTNATKVALLKLSTGIAAATAITAGTNHFLNTLRLEPTGKGSGGSHGAVNFHITGLFQKKATAPGGSAVNTITGAYFGDDVVLESGTKLIFEGSETDNITDVTITKGDSYMVFTAGTPSIDAYLNGTQAWTWTTALNKSEVVLGTKAGSSTVYGKVGGVTDVNTTAVGNVGGGEDDLITYSVPANSMATNGDSIYFEMSGTLAANANTKRIRIKYGATTMVDSTALAINNGKWTAWGRITRTGAATQNFFGELSTNNALLVSLPFEGTAAETLSGAVTLKVTGESGGSATDDVRQTNNFVRWEPNE